jgi:hypothetical protein
VAYRGELEAVAIAVDVRYFAVEVQSEGQLLPWLGPSMRGVIGGWLKSHECRWPANERDSRWKTCRGCPHQDECVYGLTFETGPGPTALCGRNDGQRAILLAPSLLDGGCGRRGDCFPLQVLLVGRKAVEAGDRVAEAIGEVSGQPLFGPDRARLGMTEIAAPAGWLAGPTELNAADLPCSPHACSGNVPLLVVELTAPLFLDEWDEETVKAREAE